MFNKYAVRVRIRLICLRGVPVAGFLCHGNEVVGEKLAKWETTGCVRRGFALGSAE